MYHTLYTVFVLVSYPTIPVDLKFLGDSQFKEREAATKRLESLPGWTALYFQDHAKRTKDLEVRIRCAKLYKKLDEKFEQDINKFSSDLILAMYPSIPTDLELLRNRRREVRVAATKRLESLPGFTAIYFKYHASRSMEPEERRKCEQTHSKLDLRWRNDLASLYLGFQWEIARAQARRGSQNLKATIVASLAKLSTEDLKLALAQGGCPIHEDVPLGGKGSPVKILLKGHPVMLCCKDCIKEAQANPDKTLAKVKELKENHFWSLRRFLTKAQLEKLEESSPSSKEK